MPGVTAPVDTRLDEGEIRNALEHMAASEAFRGSPQLVAFLRYVVEARLRGAHERIKGYTIAVEALGRGDDFDPQSDPIVRVEATRLRRALTRYYSNGGAVDPVVIDLPLGSYVPVFRRNEAPPAPEQPAPEQPAAASPPAPPQDAPPPQVPAGSRGGWVRIAAALACFAAGAGAYALLHQGFDFNMPHAMTGSVVPERAASTRPASIFPVVYVGAFDADAGAAAQATAERLRVKLRDALARFDKIAVITDPPPSAARLLPAAGQAGQYGVSARIDAGANGALTIAVRLSDLSDGRILFVRTYHTASGAPDEPMVREVAVALAQPYGVIHARERTNLLARQDGDPRYRCLSDYYEYFRTFDPAEHSRVRDCLERATAADPSFAAGYSALAEIILQEHRRRLEPRPGDGPPLDRALAAARRAVELRPASAHGHQALMDALFLRGDHAQALQAGEKALSLNPYSPNTLACYGARLLALGHIEKGARLMREAAAASAVRPAWHDFFLFLAAYLEGDQRLAASHVAQISSDTFTLGLLARTLAAVQHGRADLARQHYERLANLQPGWRDIAREARKVFPADAVAQRIVADLAKVNDSVGQ
jgi:tetratricopeptide (TPR) repeat protein